MLSKQFFTKLKKDFSAYESERRKIISRGNDALQKSKQAIFALHRGEMKSAEDILALVENNFKDLTRKFKDLEKLKYEGAYLAALEEYTEAKFFCNFLKTGKIGEIKEIKIGHDSYLGGLCDFTGELVRRGISEATRGDIKAVEKIKAAIEAVVGELIQMNLTGYLRTKYDQAKSNLRKIEEILYEVKLRR